MEKRAETITWVDETVAYWKSISLKLNPGASDEKAVYCEMQMDFKFSQDFKDFHKKMDGFEDYEWSEDMMSLWSYDRILKEFNEEGRPDYVTICDYLIRSCDYVFKNGDQRVYKHVGNCFESIAPSFQQFVGLLMADDKSLY